jgi:predicted aspartyl protease
MISAILGAGGQGNDRSHAARIQMSRLWFIAVLMFAGIVGTQALAYDDTWYQNKGWSGEYPFGFTVANDTVIDIRETPDPTAPKMISCQLKKGATYHEWNVKRVKSDELEFTSFTKIEPYETKSAFTFDVTRQSDDRKARLNFSKGDRWFFMAYLAEGYFLLKFKSTVYVADESVIGKSTKIPAAKSGQRDYDEWLKLKCANGTVGWLFVKEIKNSSGFSVADIEEYGKASDQPDDKRRAKNTPSTALVAPLPPKSIAPAQSPSGHFPIAVPMKREGGTYAVPVLINSAITLDFVVDSGATDVTIPADVVMTLIRTGTLSYAAFIGEKTYTLADGSKTTSKTFLLQSLKVGGKTVEGVIGSISPPQGGLLLGQSFLNRFRSWSIDNSTHLLLLNE